MSNEQTSNGPSVREDDLERLFSHTEPRVRPAAADELRVRETLHAEWQTVVGRRIWVARASWGMAAAVALLLAVTVLVQVQPSLLYGEPPTVASLARVDGDIAVMRDGVVLPDSTLTPGLPILGGQVIDTRGGRAAIDLAQGGSLRLDADTRIALVSSREIELLRGALYFDSQLAGEAAEPLTVRTRVGSVRDVGTQFIARLEPDLIELSVREGAVAVTRGSEQIEAHVGEQLTVPDAGAPSRTSVAPFGAEWGWAEQLAPAYDLDGQTVFDFLSWLQRETGRRVVFVSPEAESRARRAVLRGGRIDLEPMPMLRAVLATTDFRYSVTAGEIAVAVP